MKEDNQFVTMTHESCIICGKDTNEGILLHRQLKDISALHNKSTGFSKPCDECQSAIDQGAIMMIVADADKSGKTHAELYRTGNIFGISEEWARRAINEPMLSEVLKNRLFVMDYRDAVAIGLPVEYTP